MVTIFMPTHKGPIGKSWLIGKQHNLATRTDSMVYIRIFAATSTDAWHFRIHRVSAFDWCISIARDGHALLTK